MAAMSALGLFSEPEYISIGDPYTSDRTKGQKLSRYSGKQFSGAPPKKGQTAGDVYFSAFQRLYEGEKYTNPGAADRAADAAKAKAKIAGDWCPNNPPKRNCGRGSYYGTIGDKFTHMGSGAASRSSREKVTTSALPNIRTNPAKLGGFGVPNTTIGNSPKYESEPYYMARKQEREASAVANHKRIGTAFKVTHGTTMHRAAPCPAPASSLMANPPWARRHHACCSPRCFNCILGQAVRLFCAHLIFRIAPLRQ